MMSQSFPILYKLLLSAQLLKKCHLKIMFINKLNEIGPAIEPWDTPACNFFAELRLLFIYAIVFGFLSN